MIEKVLITCAFLCGSSFLALAALLSARRERSLRLLSTYSAAVFSIVLAVALTASGPVLTSIATALACSCVVVCAVTDHTIGLVFDVVTFPSAAGIVALTVLSGFGSASILGLLTGFTTIFLLWFLTRGRGIGLGDAKLTAVMGAACGGASVFTVIGAAFVLGATVACFGLATGRLKRGDTLRFAPYLAGGFVLATTLTKIYA